jgi:hypothetical protein
MISGLFYSKLNGQEAETAWQYGNGLNESLKKHQEADNLT